MKVLRTPDHCFSELPEFDFTPHYLSVNDGQTDELRLHYLDEGPQDGRPVLLMHGEPSWGFLYRKMIPLLVAQGYRVLVPDLIGFGKSDKPAERTDYTYQRHVNWMSDWLNQLELENIVLFCQDWGGLIGLRMLASELERFSGAIAANTGLPTGDHAPSAAFLEWREFSQTVLEFPVGQILQGATVSELNKEVVAAYDAPYPSEAYKAGARQFPILVPISPDDPASEDNRNAWKVLSTFEKPFLTAFSDQDPVTSGGHKIFQKMIPGCTGQRHLTIKGGGHFLQEDKGEKLADVVIQFINDNSL